GQGSCPAGRGRSGDHQRDVAAKRGPGGADLRAACRRTVAEVSGLHAVGNPLSDASLRTGLLALRLILQRAVRTKQIAANPMHEVEWRGTPRVDNVDPFTGPDLRAILL